jgi:hypothetical protein
VLTPFVHGFVNKPSFYTSELRIDITISTLWRTRTAYFTTASVHRAQQQAFLLLSGVMLTSTLTALAW